MQSSVKQAVRLRTKRLKLRLNFPLLLVETRLWKSPIGSYEENPTSSLQWFIPGHCHSSSSWFPRPIKAPISFSLYLFFYFYLASGCSSCCLFDFARHVSSCAPLIGLECSLAGRLPPAEQEPSPRSRAGGTVHSCNSSRLRGFGSAPEF